MPIQFIEDVDTTVDGHRYRVHKLDPNLDWLTAAAKAYIALRTECAVPVNQVSVEGLDLVDPAGVQAYLARATLPYRREDNFDVIRSDLGELLAHSLLEQVDNTQIGYKGIRDRELTQLPGRGLDIVGIEEDGAFTLLLGEVKVSDDSKCPPQVVDSARDGLRKQHLHHVKELTATAKKIWDQTRRVQNTPLRDKLFAAALLLENNRLDKVRIVACAVLVRSQAKYSEGDRGTFASSPADFAPANVRFQVIVLPESVTKTVRAWYKRLEAEIAA